MPAEVWTIIIAVTGVLTTALGSWLAYKIKPKDQIVEENSNARVSSTQADIAEIELWEREKGILIESKNFAWDEFRRVEGLLKSAQIESNRAKEESDKRFEEVSSEMKNLERLLKQAYRERDFYKSLLVKLTEIVKSTCKNIDLTEYLDHIDKE
jgi:hypothetical protein